MYDRCNFRYGPLLETCDYFRVLVFWVNASFAHFSSLMFCVKFCTTPFPLIEVSPALKSTKKEHDTTGYFLVQPLFSPHYTYGQCSFFTKKKKKFLINTKKLCETKTLMFWMLLQMVLLKVCFSPSNEIIFQKLFRLLNLDTFLKNMFILKPM